MLQSTVSDIIHFLFLICTIDPNQYHDHLSFDGYMRREKLEGVETLKGRLTNHGFRYDERIRGDGHCQFRSLAHQLFGKIQDDDVRLLRKQVAEWIKENGDSYFLVFHIFNYFLMFLLAKWSKTI